MGIYVGINPRNIKVNDQVYLIDSANATLQVAICIKHNYVLTDRYRGSKYKTSDGKIINYRPGAQYRLFTDLNEATNYLIIRATKRKEYLEDELARINNLLSNTNTTND